jgi:hypothetical protein
MSIAWLAGGRSARPAASLVLVVRRFNHTERGSRRAKPLQKWGVAGRFNHTERGSPHAKPLQKRGVAGRFNHTVRGQAS